MIADLEFDVGDVTVARVIEDELAMFSRERFFPESTKQGLLAERDWLGELYDPQDDAIGLCVQGYVFQVDGKTILVDTCVGNDKEGRFPPRWNNAKFPFIENLAKVGHVPEDIDLVMCTHLHLDHCGWNTRLENGKWVPTFPNAEYLTVETELEHLKSSGVNGDGLSLAIYNDSVLPVIDSGQAVLVRMDHKVSSSVQLIPTPGHSPGHVAIELSSNGQKALAIGDIVHHPIQSRYPGLNSFADEDPEQASATRGEMFRRLADTDSWMLPAHFSPCHVKSSGDDFRFDMSAIQKKDRK